MQLYNKQCDHVSLLLLIQDLIPLIERVMMSTPLSMELYLSGLHY